MKSLNPSNPHPPRPIPISYHLSPFLYLCRTHGAGSKFNTGDMDGEPVPRATISTGIWVASTCICLIPPIPPFTTFLSPFRYPFGDNVLSLSPPGDNVMRMLCIYRTEELEKIRVINIMLEQTVIPSIPSAQYYHTLNTHTQTNKHTLIWVSGLHDGLRCWSQPKSIT